MKTLRKSIPLLLGLTLCATAIPATAYPVMADDGEQHLTILYTNDVHGAIDGYSVLAGYKEQLSEDGRSVLAVDAGDSIQGEVIDQLTRGEASVDLMNATPYDYATLGNHEFDYKVPRILELSKKASYKYISCNFTSVSTGASEFAAYDVRDFGDYQVGFIGITTPETYTKSTPTYFMDDNGNYIYSFNEDKLYSIVQNAIDGAKKEGSDYIVAIGHTGMNGTEQKWNTQTIIENTSGIDAYIDGHSHEEIQGPDYQGTTFKDKDGKSVIETSTGTKFKYIGEMDITYENGNFSTETKLVKTEDAKAAITSDKAKAKEASVQSIIDEDNEQISALDSNVLGTAETALYTNDPKTGNRMVRSRECSAGDFVADAYRTVLNADIGLANGGGVRTDLEAGDITERKLMDMNPFGNSMCVIRATGQQILDALEHGARNLPNENGGFLQVSGLTYTIDPGVESPVVCDEKGSFKEIPAGAKRRVKDVMVGGKPIDPNAKYTVAASEYMLLTYGDGMTMWKNAELVKSSEMVDNEVLKQYVTENLGGKITAEMYGNAEGSGRIKIELDSTPTVMYRVYNPNSGEHFFTESKEEKDYLVSLGWHDESIGWYAPKTSMTPVYRLYNANAGEHHYTTSADEKKQLIAAGWNDEGIGWYSDDASTVCVYRVYNPNEFANNHHFTTDESEKNYLVSLGWRDEEIGWYGVEPAA